MRPYLSILVLGAGLVAAEAAAQDVETGAGMLPVVGSVHGAFGSHFKTSLQLTNPRQTAMSGRLLFHPAGTVGNQDDTDFAWHLEAGATVGFADIAEAMGLEGIGNLVIFYPGRGFPDPFFLPPVVSARIYNEAPDGATSGCNEDLKTDFPGIIGTLTTGVLAGPIDVARFRFNVGVLSGNAEEVPLRIDVRDGGGNLVHTVTSTYPPRLFVQSTVTDLLGGFEIGDNYSLVFLFTGTFVVYGATVDNETNSPSLQIMPYVLVSG